jgi:hypothetical protein
VSSVVTLRASARTGPWKSASDGVSIAGFGQHGLRLLTYARLHRGQGMRSCPLGSLLLAVPRDRRGNGHDRPCFH